MAAAGAKPEPSADRRNHTARSRVPTGAAAAARSAYFARREAAKVLRSVLLGDARRRAVGTVKSLVYSAFVRNKKATFALVCETLKHLDVLKRVLEDADVLNGKWKRQKELVYVTAYDLLFGRMIFEMEGEVEKFLVLKENVLQVALAKICAREKIKYSEELVSGSKLPAFSKPRYARVNTLKVEVDSVVQILEKGYQVRKDDMVPDLLVLPSGTDLHAHPLVTNGSIFLQGKASCMPAWALMPETGWKVLDACAAPGNKTVQLAAIMKGTGKVIACELNKERVGRLEGTITRCGASNIEILHGDFLEIDPEDPSFSTVQAILLDPSCSGSGTSAERLDHLLPSNSGMACDEERLKKLAAFQTKALSHALSFPSVRRIVYSTCSIHELENEQVIKSVLPLAASLGFQLETPFPQWPRRGLPVLEGSEHLLRTDPADGLEGFFVALFVKRMEETDGIIVPVDKQQTPSRKNISIMSRNKYLMRGPFRKMLFLSGLRHIGQSRRKR